MWKMSKEKGLYKQTDLAKARIRFIINLRMINQ